METENTLPQRDYHGAHILQALNELPISRRERDIDMHIDMINEIKAAMAELEYSGFIERTGEMRWAERSHEWQPVYALTEVGRALSAADISLDDYQDSGSWLAEERNNPEKLRQSPERVFNSRLPSRQRSPNLEPKHISTKSYRRSLLAIAELIKTMTPALTQALLGTTLRVARSRHGYVSWWL
jgi:hypothetical protein